MAKKKLRKLGKLGVAILEGYLEKKIGKPFVKELRKGHKEHEALIEALANTEERFREKFKDKEITKAIFDDLSLDGLPSLKTAYKAFYKHPTDPLLPLALKDLFSSDFSKRHPARINKAIAAYLTFLKEELSQLDDGFRENARAISDFSREQLLQEILTTLKEDSQASADIPENVSAKPLHQLPPVPADFTGREEEIEELLDAVKERGATISGVRGQGGIGKTVLALKAAHKLAEDYSDAQIFLDLHGVEKGKALSAEEAIAHVIRSFDPTIQLPEDSDALKGFYHSALQGKRALLLMDNALDAAQVEPLIPPEGCLMMVTSRQHFSIPGFHTLDLSQLDGPEAVDLLKKIAPRIGDAAEDIAKLCGYLPLALRFAASLLKERKDISPESYIETLKSKRKRLEIVEASLSLSYELLSEEKQAYWRKLAFFPDTFFADAAAAVWGEKEDEAKDILWELHSYSLLEWDESAKRYQLHDLARLFAESKLGKREAYAAAKAHSQHFKDVLSFAHDLFLRGDKGVLTGLKLYDLERRNIEPGQRWAAAHWQEDTEAAQLVMSYPGAGTYVLSLRQHAQERIDWLGVAISAAEKLGDKKALGVALGNLGIAYAALSQTQMAIEYFEQVLTIFREIGDQRGEGSALGNLGLAYAALSQTQKAIEYYEQRLEIAREIGDRRGEGSALGNLGNAYAVLGQTQKAIEYFEQVLAIFREIGVRRGEGSALGNLGNAYADLGQTQKAIEYYEQQLEIVREIGDRRGEGSALGNLGSAYADLGQSQKAIVHHQKALVISREIGDRRAEGQDLGNLGNAYSALGQTQEAIDHHQKALAISREIGDRRAEGQDLGNLGTAYAALGQTQKAIEYYEQRLEIAREIGDRRGEGTGLWNLALGLKKLKRDVEALQSAKEALAIYLEIAHPSSEEVRNAIEEWESESS